MPRRIPRAFSWSPPTLSPNLAALSVTCNLRKRNPLHNLSKQEGSRRMPKAVSASSGTCATLGAGPLLHHAANLGRRGKLSPVSFRQRLAGFLDLPLVHLHIFADRFRRHKRAAAALRLRQTVQPFPQLGFQAYRHYRGGRHDALLTQPNTSDSTTSRRRGKKEFEEKPGDRRHVPLVLWADTILENFPSVPGFPLVD